MVQTSLDKNDKLKELDWNWQGHKIRYTVAGKGIPLVLIHGFGASIGHWRKNIPVLAENGYRVFALDLLGFGGSDKAFLDYTLELWQEQIKDFWSEHIDRPTVFIGNSIGALLSLMLVTNYPEISAGGVLINCAGGLNHRPGDLNPVLGLVMGGFAKLINSPITGKFIFNNIRRKSQIRRTLYQVYRDRNAVTDELVEMLYQPSCDDGAQKVFASVLTAPPGNSPDRLLVNLQRPLLILWGEKDPWTPVTGAKVYQDLAIQNPDVQFQIIENAGHCPHDENPEVVNSKIIDWLPKVEANLERGLF
ncbi:alpha/beta fold hydrolase [Waterburya agarophytonicola K14]|uniref:Alpha/beta fold hydrolase n=1 Tax=Waterburya agarophytonicola KI4 TaxID=2874699 RepID=A0A964BM71_9CYAN|nr:alpha/beta fold hydrolase [Waterburya agarophytonicola]MCC0175984.1 alpha/beta fold hydrolase [Waterburya agarophytonicola KI4]